MQLDQRVRRVLSAFRRRVAGGGVDHEPLVEWVGAPARPRPRSGFRLRLPRSIGEMVGFGATFAVCAALYLVLAAMDARAPSAFEAQSAHGATPAGVATALALLRHAAPEAIGVEPPLLLSDKIARRDLLRRGAARAVGGFAAALAAAGGAAAASALAPAAALEDVVIDGAALNAAATALERRQVSALYDEAPRRERLAQAASAASRALAAERDTLRGLKGGVVNRPAARAATVARGVAMGWRALLIAVAADAGFGATREEAQALAAAERTLAEVAAFEPLFFLDLPDGLQDKSDHPALYDAKLAAAEAAIAALAGAAASPPPTLRGLAE